jgi:hypothetical protein
MVVLKAYFDESGLHGNSQVFTIAGYVAPEEEWDERFCPKWRGILKMPQIRPPLEFFHAADLEGLGSGRFRLITQPEREQLKTDAVNTVVNSGLLGIASAVLMQAYRQFVVGKAKEVIGDQYLLCFQHVIIETAKRAKTFLNEDCHRPIAFIFARQPRWEALARKLYRKMLDKQDWRHRYRLGTIEFADAKECPPLQGADHLAYETYRYMAQPDPPRPAMRRFLSWPQCYGKYFNHAALQDLIEQLRKSGKL